MRTTGVVEQCDVLVLVVADGEHGQGLVGEGRPLVLQLHRRMEHNRRAVERVGLLVEDVRRGVGATTADDEQKTAGQVSHQEDGPSVGGQVLDDALRGGWSGSGFVSKGKVGGSRRTYMYKILIRVAIDDQGTRQQKTNSKQRSAESNLGVSDEHCRRVEAEAKRTNDRRLTCASHFISKF